MEIIRGKIPGAKKVVIYGPEGIGKSTFASRFPDPLFIDVEGSTKEMDVARTKKPSSWTMLFHQMKEVVDNPSVCKTLVIDTIDWAEQMCVEHICARHNKEGIESFGYGNGYVYAKEEFGRFLNRLEEIIGAGIHVVLVAHAQMRKFEQPDELGAYDRYEMKLGKKTSSQISPLVKEWADMVLFANYKTFAVAVDDKGKKHKAQGGKRVMYTAHHPCWDAKNRYGLPEEMEFDYAAISHILRTTTTEKPATTVTAKSQITNPPAKPKKEKPANSSPKPETKQSVPAQEYREPPAKDKSIFHLPENIPKALQDLMYTNVVLEDEIRKVVSQKGYYPESTPIENYAPEFIDGCLVAAWDKVYEMIRQAREKEDEIPFN